MPTPVIDTLIHSRIYIHVCYAYIHSYLFRHTRTYRPSRLGRRIHRLHRCRGVRSPTPRTKNILILNWTIPVRIREPFNCANKLALTHLKIRLPINYFLTNHMYNHLTAWKQMSSDSFKNVINKLYVYKSYIKKLATLVEGDLTAPFLIDTTRRCRRERYSIPWIAPPYPWSLPYNAEC